MRLVSIQKFGRYRFFITNALKLVGSGVLATLCLILMASNNVFRFPTEFTTRLILFFQWETMGLTIAKLGMDSFTYAQVTKSINKIPDFGRINIFGSILALTFCGFSLFIYPLKIVLLLFGAIILDVNSAVFIALLNAKEKYNRSVTASLLNYPLFFVILLIYDALVYYSFSFFFIICLFLFSSFIRFLFLLTDFKRGNRLTAKIDKVNLLLGVQQALNYYAYKADQIIFNLTALLIFFQLKNVDLIIQLLFFCKIAELIGGLCVALSPLYLSRIYKYKANGSLPSLIKKNVMYILLVVIGIILLFLGSMVIWKGAQPLNLYLCIPYVFFSLLMLPVYQITYNFFRNNRIKNLVSILLRAVSGGIVLFILAIIFKDLIFVSYIPFLNLLLILIITAISAKNLTFKRIKEKLVYGIK